jgi:hypothetical protein
MSQQMKYCNRCGSQLTTTKEGALIETTEKRLYEEGVDLFWVTVIGLALILGGMVVMRKVLQLSDALIIAYMILSSTAFTINFALSLWQIRRLARISEEARANQIGRDLKEPDQLESRPAPEPLASITEHTTRTLEPVSRE